LYNQDIVKTFFKPNATLFTMSRDGFLILPELYRRYLNMPTSISILSAGVTVALLTHPLDRIKTALQVDMSGTYRNALDVTTQLWKKGGIKELYAGGLWRGTRVCTAITIMSAICKKCHELID
jgi:hypothetical protein